MHGQIITKSVKNGEVVFCKTKTAEYWLLFMGEAVANVYRRGEGKEFCLFLGKRRVDTVIEEGKGLMMFDGDGEQITAIVPIEISKVSLDSIPQQERREVV